MAVDDIDEAHRQKGNGQIPFELAHARLQTMFQRGVANITSGSVSSRLVANQPQADT
jgi:hypothetical protein